MKLQRQGFIFFGLFIVGVGVGVEFLPNSAPGLGAYQFYVLVFGLVVLSRGITRPNSLLGKVSVTLFGLLIFSGFIEIGATLVEKSQPISSSTFAPSQVIQDPVLGSRMTPNTPGYDANGFRNEVVPDHADIVAIGDSQTLGINVRVEDTWPFVLSQLSGNSVYSMALGGYGPVQYAILAQQALEYTPDVVIIGLYFGGDFYNVYETVYFNDRYTDLRLLGNDELHHDTIGERLNLLTDRRGDFMDNLRRSQPLGLIQMFAQQTATGRLLVEHGILTNPEPNVNYQQANIAWAEHFPEDGAIYQNAGNTMVFTPAHRLLALDLNDIRIQEGLRLTKNLLGDIAENMKPHEATLVVLLIPTKELVYSDLIQDYPELSSTFENLVLMETQARNDIILFLDSKDIDFIDPLPALRAAAKEDLPIYALGPDGHPAPKGYAALAQAIVENLLDFLPH